MPDRFSHEMRSWVMSRIPQKNTSIEKRMFELLMAAGYSFETHCPDLPGRPDIVFREQKVVIFIDGDFWHGWRFNQWKDKLNEYWSRKIQKNRFRDEKNHKKLRRLGWRVIRLWGHQIIRDPEGCIEKIVNRINSA
jgi:DNA mismatch endonuclease (patch repair protein)